MWFTLISIIRITFVVAITNLSPTTYELNYLAQNVNLSSTVSITTSPMTLTSNPSATQLPIAPSSDIDDSVTYSDLVDVHKQVIEAIKWIVIVVLTILAGSSIGAAYFIHKGVNDINNLQSKIVELKAEFDKTRQQNETLKEQIQLQHEVQIAMEEKAKIQATEYDRFQNEIKSLRERLNIINLDIAQNIPRLTNLAEVDTFAMSLFSNKSKKSRIARAKLMELSKDSDAVVRRACVCVWRVMPQKYNLFNPENHHEIIDRLTEMANHDPERGVQIEAKRALESFGIKQSN